MGSWTYGPGDPRDAYLVSGVFSCTLAFLVVVTYLLFPRLQGKLFMRVITLISLCDLIANASVLGGVSNQRDLCVLQAVVQQFFYPASWIWTAILTYLLYSLVMYGKISMLEWHMHAITWGFCTMFTVLPLTTSTYGSQANDDSWCWIQPRSLSHTDSAMMSTIWDYLTFDAIIFGSFFLMTLWGTVIYYKLRIQQIPTTKTVQSALRALLLYPIVLFVTWFPNAIVLTADQETAENSTRMLIINCLSIWQGGLTAMVFFTNSGESRAHWKNLFSVCLSACCCGNKLQDQLHKEDNRDSVISAEMNSVSVTVFFNRLRNIEVSPSRSQRNTNETC